MTPGTYTVTTGSHNYDAEHDKQQTIAVGNLGSWATPDTCITATDRHMHCLEPDTCAVAPVRHNYRAEHGKHRSIEIKHTSTERVYYFLNIIILYKGEINPV